MRWLRLLTGYRHDLQLPSRWWHRLATVVFILTIILLTVFLLLQADGLFPAPTLQNTHIAKTITDVRLEGHLSDAGAALLRVPGKLAVLGQDGSRGAM
jgi:hypothetical protein